MALDQGELLSGFKLRKIPAPFAPSLEQKEFSKYVWVY